MKKEPFYIIKNRNGERFAHAIQNFMNIPNIEEIVHFAGKDATPLLLYLKSLNGIKIIDQSTHGDPIKLLNMAGYNAYIADTFEKQNAIKKYFQSNEELCTFKDEYRFERNFIINAVRKNINKIKRPDTPSRDDEYGTSVISIQIAKDGSGIIITNRYNHHVINPNKTFDGNPDNIISGLSDALKHRFNIDFSARTVLLPKPFVLVDNQICKYNQVIDNVFFGDDFYVKNGKITQLDKGRQIQLGNGFILDLHTKTVSNPACLPDEFGNAIESAIRNKKIQVKKNPDMTKSLVADGEKVFDIKDNMIVAINTPRASMLDLSQKNLRGYLNASYVDNLFLNHSQIKYVRKMLINPHAESINMDYIHGLNGTINMYDVNTINASHTDFTKVKKLILNPNAHDVDLSYTTGLHGVLNMENVKYIDLSYADLTKVSVLKLNPRAVSINLNGTVGLCGKFDLRYVKHLDIMFADLSHAKIICDIKKLAFSNGHSGH